MSEEVQVEWMPGVLHTTGITPKKIGRSCLYCVNGSALRTLGEVIDQLKDYFSIDLGFPGDYLSEALEQLIIVSYMAIVYTDNIVDYYWMIVKVVCH